MNYLITTILLIANWSSALGASSLEKVNSASLSEIRFKIRLIEDPVSQCLAYLKGIDHKINGSTNLNEEERKNFLQRVDTELLIKVRNLLRDRKTVYGPSSLVEFTENCITVLENYLHTKENWHNVSEVDKFRFDSGSDEKSIISEIEEDNSKLRSEINTLKSKIEMHVKALDILEAEKESKEGDLSKYKSDTMSLLTNAQDEIKHLKLTINSMTQNKQSIAEERDKCFHDLESMKNSRNHQRNQNDIENAKVQAQRERDKCIDQLNRSNDAKSHCELDLEMQRISANLEKRVSDSNLRDCQAKVSLMDDSKREAVSLSEEISKLHVNLKECKKSLDSSEENRVALEKCQGELADVKKGDSEVDYADCNQRLKELKQGVMKVHTAINTIRKERDNCYDNSKICMRKANIYDEMTRKVDKYLKKGYDVYCSKWKIRSPHDHDSNSDDSDSDDSDSD